MKKALKIVLFVFLALLALVLAYVAYVFIDYHRLPDKLALAAEGTETAQAQTDTPYKLVSWNVGFGAYESDYSFFMDGGTQSWAWSKERLDKNLKAIGQTLAGRNADFYFLQEVDLDATRTYHTDEKAALLPALGQTDSVFAINYDSPFLMYPLTQPHGKSVAGILTACRFQITSSLRRSLPVEGGVRKFLDLDRCYSVSRVPVQGGKELCLYNIHLSAYSSDGSIADEQFKMLIADMRGEAEKGNYVICGGDFNKDLLGNSGQYFGVSTAGYTWTQALHTELLEGTGLTLEAPLDKDNPVPSCRNADAPYHKGQLVLTIDGFIVSGNVSVSSAQVLDEGFRCSDHNPVELTFTLKAS
jgi:endonuclease/exonuclease/phosphatase family metal-dependent hydrolase